MTLTAAQRAELDEVGFVHIAAFSSADAAVMQDAVWDELGRVHGVRRDDVGSWPRGPVFGLQHIREEPAFAPIGGGPLRGALDKLLGAGAWDVPTRSGAFLVTFPSPGPAWTVPHHVWHADFPHPWLLHCPAPNCARAPRFMRSLDLYRRECHPAVFRLPAPGGSC